MTQAVRVRIAPSPTGDPHVGTAYMALFNLLFARHHNGKFVLRIEDTDQSRCRPEYEESIFHALRWCGIDWDEGPDVGGAHGPYRQSERLDLYQEHCQTLIDTDKAYKCFCTPEELAERRLAAQQQGGRAGYDRRCRHLPAADVADREGQGLPFTVRLKVPLEGECVYEDAVKGECSFPWADVDDQVLMKSDGFPTYHLANIVDDHLMEITHVIRGDEWISSTPKHILLYEYFGWTPPVFMHMPLLLGTDGKKLSKRKNPTSIFYYRDSGYLPEAFLNFLSLMGYSMTEDREIYELSEVIREFDAKRIGKSGAVFDVTKLDWLNQQYLINKVPQDQLWKRMKQWCFSDDFMERLMPLCHTRLQNFGDFMRLFHFLFVNELDLSPELLQPKGISPTQACAVLQTLIWHMEENENWRGAGLEAASRAVSEVLGVHHKKIVMAILFGSIVGKRSGPPLFDSVTLLGKDRTRARLLQAMAFLGGLGKKKISKLESAWKAGDAKEFMESAKEG